MKFFRKKSETLDQRRAPRRELRTRVEFLDEFGQPFLKFYSIDLSLFGLFLESPIRFVDHAKVMLKFWLDENEAPIEVSGEIARNLEPPRGPGRKRKDRVTGFGIRFLGLSPADFERIGKFVEATTTETLTV